MNVIDPIAGNAAGGAQQGATCLNCNAVLAGPYCSECGQRGKVNRSLTSFFADFVSGLVNFEGRLWHTLPLLVWKPGELTRRYVEGQRVRFVSPVGLYLFTVFLMFAVLGFTGAMTPISFNKSVDQALEKQQVALKKLEIQRAEAVKAGRNVAPIDAAIAENRKDAEQLKNVQGGIIQTDLDDNPDNPAWLKSVIKKAAADPRETTGKIQEAASKYSWLLIPFSVPVLRLLFPFRRRRLYDHTVFVTYSLSFMMFLVIAGGLLVMAHVPALAAFLLFIPPIHMYRQLRGAYRLRWWDALFRTFILFQAAGIVLILWFLAIAALGIME